MDPWAIEQNRVEFTHKGLKCVVLRGTMLGQLNGYVAVPQGHPLYGKNKDDDHEAFSGLLTHGGITWTDSHEPLKEPDGFWWIGFDTCHARDLAPVTIVFTPELARMAEREMGASYKEYDYVRDATEVLADQVSGMGAKITNDDEAPK